MVTIADPAQSPARAAARPSVLERAFQIARSGRCPSLPALTRQLKNEGYTGVPTALAGPSLRKQLRELCARSAQADDDGGAVSERSF